MALTLHSVSLAVIEYLRKHIITGQLHPGQKLNEVELSSLLNISRGPLREAFRVLEAENLLFTIPRKGTFVSEMNQADFTEVLETRSMLELWAINLIRDRKITNLDKIASSIKEIDKRPMPDKDARPEEKLDYLLCFAEFHKQIVISAENLRLEQFYERFSSSLLRYQYGYFYTSLDRTKFKLEHEEILAAMEAGDYEEAKRLLGDHIHIGFELNKIV